MVTSVDGNLDTITIVDTLEEGNVEILKKDEDVLVETNKKDEGPISISPTFSHVPRNALVIEQIKLYPTTKINEEPKNKMDISIGSLNTLTKSIPIVTSKKKRDIDTD